MCSRNEFVCVLFIETLNNHVKNEKYRICVGAKNHIVGVETLYFTVFTNAIAEVGTF